jgi:hypothetical protein
MASVFGSNSLLVILRERPPANLFLKPRRPKNLRFTPVKKISFDLNRQKYRPCCLKGKILRRPMIFYPNNKCLVGLLRMTNLNPGQYINLTPMGEGRSLQPGIWLWSLDSGLRVAFAEVTLLKPG